MYKGQVLGVGLFMAWLAHAVGLAPIIGAFPAGLLFEPGSEEGLADAVCRLLAEPDLRLRLGAAARDRAQNEFSAAAWVAQLQATYLEAIGKRR